MLLTMMTIKTSSCWLCPPFYNTAMVLCWCQGNHHHTLYLPCMCPPYAPGGEGGERIITNNNYPRGNDNNVRPSLPTTQQPAIGKGGWGGSNKDNKEEDCDGCWRMTGKAAVALAKKRRVQWWWRCIVLCDWWRRNIIALASLPSLQWRCCRCCTGLFANVVMPPLLLLRRCLCHCCTSIVALVVQQKHQRNKGEDTSTLRAMTPVQQQHVIGHGIMAGNIAC